MRERISGELAPRDDIVQFFSDEGCLRVYFFWSEALTNVVKHARATSAWVRVEFDDARCVVEVRDDGIGEASQVLLIRRP